jgi:tricarballylate dehydrogenase
VSIEARRTDLVVVGCGIAGLSAAVSALQGGLQLTLLERAPEAEFGGNTRWTEAYMRMKNDAEIADDFEEHFATNAGPNLDPNVLAEAAQDYSTWSPPVRAHPFPDPEVISTFAAKVPPTIAWLKTFGLKFGPQPTYLLTQNTARIAALGGASRSSSVSWWRRRISAPTFVSEPPPSDCSGILRAVLLALLPRVRMA